VRRVGEGNITYSMISRRRNFWHTSGRSALTVMGRNRQRREKGRRGGAAANKGTVTLLKATVAFTTRK